MNDDIYSFHEDFDKNFEEAMKKHPAGTKATKNASKRVTNEEAVYAGLSILWFFFVTIPLALLFAGLAVVPVAEAIFGTEIGFWTAFFLLMTLRWLIPRPRRTVPIEKGR